MEKIISEINYISSEIKDLQETLIDAMKNCINENKNTDYLLTLGEEIINKIIVLRRFIHKAEVENYKSSSGEYSAISTTE